MRRLLLLLMIAATSANAQTMKQWRDSLDVINKQIAVYPDSLNLLLSKASLSLQLLEWNDAIDVCKEVLDKDKNNLSALFYRAYAYNSLRRYELAKNDYELFLRMSPHNMEARLGLAYTYIRLGRHNEALDEMNNLVEMFPDSSVVYAARSELEKEMKSYDTALYDIDQALKREPGNRDYIVSKVDILLLADKRQEAKRVLDEAVSNGVPRGLLLEWYKKCK